MGWLDLIVLHHIQSWLGHRGHDRLFAGMLSIGSVVQGVSRVSIGMLHGVAVGWQGASRWLRGIGATTLPGAKLRWIWQM